MKIPSLKRILREDLKDAPTWIDGVINPVNSFMEYMYQAMNKNISYFDNVACSIREFTYVTPSTYPTMDDVEFQSLLKVKATDVRLMQIYDKETFLPPTATAVYIPWTENNGSIIIKSIPGLTASKSYLIRIKIS
jgi:hypothetical protein